MIAKRATITGYYGANMGLGLVLRLLRADRAAMLNQARLVLSHNGQPIPTQLQPFVATFSSEVMGEAVR